MKKETKDLIAEARNIADKINKSQLIHAPMPTLKQCIDNADEAWESEEQMIAWLNDFIADHKETENE